MFVRKLDKQVLRNYKWTTLITSSAIWGQFLQRMRKNGNKTTSGLQFHDIFELSIPDFLYGGKFWTSDHGFWYF